MTKILKIDLSKLRNAAHNALMEHFKGVVKKYTAAKLGVDAQFNAFLTVYKAESDFFIVTQKSNLSDDVETRDAERDELYRAFVQYIKVLTRHFTPATAAAALRIKNVLDAKGDIPILPNNDETAELANVIAELKTTYAADVTATATADWLAQLQTKNDAFDLVWKDRNTQQAAKIHAQAKVLRTATDAAYKTVVERINSLIIVNGDANYKAFVNEYNEYVDKEKTLLAQRAGRNAAKKNKPTDSAPNTPK
jgi:hypothetical protein